MQITSDLTHLLAVASARGTHPKIMETLSLREAAGGALGRLLDTRTDLGTAPQPAACSPRHRGARRGGRAGGGGCPTRLSPHPRLSGTRHLRLTYRPLSSPRVCLHRPPVPSPPHPLRPGSYVPSSRKAPDPRPAQAEPVSLCMALTALEAALHISTLPSLLFLHPAYCPRLPLNLSQRAGALAHLTPATPLPRGLQRGSGRPGQA